MSVFKDRKVCFARNESFKVWPPPMLVFGKVRDFLTRERSVASGSLGSR